jgi:hypothetical protein
VLTSWEKYVMTVVLAEEMLALQDQGLQLRGAPVSA